MSEIQAGEFIKELECQARGLTQWFLERHSHGQIQDVGRSFW